MVWVALIVLIGLLTIGILMWVAKAAIRNVGPEAVWKTVEDTRGAAGVQPDVPPPPSNKPKAKAAHV